MDSSGSITMTVTSNGSLVVAARGIKPVVIVAAAIVAATTGCGCK
jgi:hypothetical protein